MGMKTVAIIGALDEEVALIAKSLTHVTHTCLLYTSDAADD